jgi:hypothetical protein
LTLIQSAHDEEHNDAIVLRQLMLGRKIHTNNQESHPDK